RADSVRRHEHPRREADVLGWPRGPELRPAIRSLAARVAASIGQREDVRGTAGSYAAVSDPVEEGNSPADASRVRGYGRLALSVRGRAAIAKEESMMSSR